MRKQGSGTLILAIATFILFAVLIVQPIYVSEPVDNGSINGTRTATWIFETPGDYMSNNCTLEQGFANLSTFESFWNQTSFQNFNNGTEKNYINLSADGNISLMVSPPVKLLRNGNFSEPPVGGAADYWSVEKKLAVFPVSNSEQRSITGGRIDDLYCWKNNFVDPIPQGSNASVWLNQSFIIPSIPLSINVSVYHNFSNTSHITPGTNATVLIRNNKTGLESAMYNTGWVNESYANYKFLFSNDASFFNMSGNYTISLFTDTNSEGNDTDTPTIDNFWDDASVEFTAFEEKGNLTSQVFDTGSYAMWKNITWKENLSTGTDIELYLRTGNSSVPTDSIWSEWSAPFTDPTGSAIDRPRGQYIQYRVEFSTLSTNVTPMLESVNITYEKFQLTGRIQTLDYSPANITSWGFFTHVEELRGQSIKYQYSIDSNTLWIDMPIDGDLRTLDPKASIKIRALLSTTDTVVSPSVREMKLSYVSIEPTITLEPAWNITGAETGDTVRLHIHFNNSANSISSNAWLNVYLDDNLEYLANNSDTLASFQDYIPDDDANVQKFVFANIPIGDNTIWIDAIMGSGIADGTMLQTTVTLNYQDPLENRVESILELAYIRVNSPSITAELFSMENSADVGDSIRYQVYVNNTGYGTASKVWLNTTIDDRLQIPSQNTQNFTIEIANLAGFSNKTIYFNLTLKDNVVQNSVVPVRLAIQFSDISGFIRESTSDQVTLLTALKSSVSLTLVTQNSQVSSDELFVITVQYNNTGYGNAESIYFNMTLPDGLELDSSSRESVSFGSQYVWEIEDVGPGAHSFTITFMAQKMDQDIYTSEIQMNMQVTDPVEGELDSTISNVLSIDIQRIYTFWEDIYWPWSGIVMALAGLFIIYGLWYYLKPEPPSIDDIFVIYRDGRLISHRKSSSGLREGLDGDLVSAMLTVVQEFISDSLSKDKTDKVKKLEFGDRELYVDRGENIHLSVMYSGSMNNKLETQIFELRQKIENEHPFLPTWDGRMTELEDINPQLDELIYEWQHLNVKEDCSPDKDA